MVWNVCSAICQISAPPAGINANEPYECDMSFSECAETATWSLGLCLLIISANAGWENRKKIAEKLSKTISWINQDIIPETSNIS